MRALLPSIGAALVLGTALSAQGTLEAYFPDNTFSGSTNTHPLNVGPTTGFTSLYVYPAATLVAQAIPGTAKLTGLAIVPASGSGSINLPTASIIVGHAAAAQSPTNWIANMADPTIVWDTAVDGPMTSPPWTALSWCPLPINTTGNFHWDGVRDLVVMISHGVYTSAAVNGVFTLITSPVPYVRHGAPSYLPPVGTATQTTGTLGARMRMSFECPGFAFTSGFGTGDLTLLLNQPFSGGVTEGYTLLSSTTNGNVGSGPMFGLWPDALTWAAIPLTPAAIGDPIHWVANHGIPGIWPVGPFQVPPGALSFLAGQTWEVVAIGFGPNFSPLETTCVSRLVW